MLPATWRTLLLLLAWAARQSQGTSGLRGVHSRSKTLQMIDGTTSEDLLNLERCTQSSVQESCVLAIDHDINQESWSNECAVTTADIRPWWSARLENPSYVSRVVIYALDKVGERGRDALTDFELMVGDHACIRYRAYSSFLNKTFSCDTYADYIRVQSNLEHSVLALCEVSVYGKVVKLSHKDNGNTPLMNPERVHGKSCLMSSVKGSSFCHLAIDGILNQDASKEGVCFMTLEERTPWWEVRLDYPALIRRITVLNRADCCQEQLNHFEVTINGQMCFKYDQDGTFSKLEFGCGRFGNMVRISNTKEGEKDVLTLCGVELFGYPIEFVSRSNFEYMGCYREKKRNRDLQKLVAINRMSAEKCERMCRRQRKPYFGMQQGQQCWCSERYGMYGQLAEDACWMRCDSNVEQACGAKLHNSIYKLTEFADEKPADDKPADKQ